MIQFSLNRSGSKLLMFNCSYLLSFRTTTDANFKSCQKTRLKIQILYCPEQTCRTMALCMNYCAREARGKAWHYELWTIGSIICLCQLYAYSISWLNKSLRKAWMLTHILFILANWLLEVLFSFCSNYFFLFFFFFKVQKI